MVLVFTQLAQASVELGYEVVRSLRFKALRTIQTVNIKIVNEFLGTSRQDGYSRTPICTLGCIPHGNLKTS